MTRSKFMAFVYALALAILAIPPAAATEKNVVIGEIEGLDIAEIPGCGTVDLPLIVKKTDSEDRVDNITFTVERLAGIDLTTEAGWGEVRELDIDAAMDAEKAGTWTKTTDAEGLATFTYLPIGVYLVTAKTPEEANYLQPVPFVITLPTGSEDGWACDRDIYAKFEPGQPEPEEPTPTTTKPPYPPFDPTPTPTTKPAEPEDPNYPGDPRPSELPSDGRPSPDPTQQGTGPIAAASPLPTLASTGAAVIGLVGVALALITLGVVLVTRRGKGD